MKRRTKIRAALLAIAMATLAACTPDKAMDFGPVGEIDAPPQDQLSRQILHDFDGRDFVLGSNDKLAEVSLTGAAAGKRILIPFWLGVNPLMPAFLRPTIGHIYVISESIMVRELAAGGYLIRAGSKLFKTDTVFTPTHTRFVGTGNMFPIVVRFVGTRVITVPKDAPATGTVTEKVPVLREVSLPMHVEYQPRGYVQYRVKAPGIAGS